MLYGSSIEKRSWMFRNSGGQTEVEREERMPARLAKRHSLEAWGYRLGIPKQHADAPVSFFEAYSKEMLDRCRSDVRINDTLLGYMIAEPSRMKGWPLVPIRAMFVESKVAAIIAKQRRNGVGFDEAAAGRLHAYLVQRKTDLQRTLCAMVPPWYTSDGPKAGLVVPKRTAKSRKYRPGEASYQNVSAGCSYTKVKRVEFNPASRPHVARALKHLYGWEPGEFTDSGQPKIDEETLSSLSYPIIPKLLEFLVVFQRLKQLALGKQAWLAHARKGRIHGRVSVAGTRTGRMSHSEPNMNVPKSHKLYGAECRALFRPTRPGWVQVGADASGLELRMLAHRLALYDDGAFAKELLQGDVHEAWRRATGLYYRENQKTLTYADLYGAGSFKRGSIVLLDWREAYEAGVTKKAPPPIRYAAELGKQVQEQLLAKVPALGYLKKRCSGAFKRGYVVLVDGSVVATKTEHGTLNDMLQGDGARVMKHALVILDETLRKRGFVHGQNFAYMLNVHDEWQIECPPDHAKTIGDIMVQSIRHAGVELRIRLPLDAEYKIGKSWKECH